MALRKAYPQGGNSYSLVLKLKVWVEAYFEVLTGTLQHIVSWHVSSCALFCSIEQCTRYFFSARHQVNAIAIGISKDNPRWLKSIDCCSFYIYMFFILPNIHTHFFMVLYCQFFKIDCFLASNVMFVYNRPWLWYCNRHSKPLKCPFCDIEYWRIYRLFLFRKSQRSKMKNIYIVLL